MALSAGCLWATLVVLGKRLVGTGADPIVLVGVRAALAFILLGAGLAVANRRLLVIRARDIPFFLLYGVTVAANYGFYFVALKHTTGTMAVLLTYTYPAMLAAMAAIFLGERLDRVKVLALVFTLAGCVLVAQAYNPGAMRVNWKGALAGLGCALGGATHAAVSKSAVGRYNSWTLVLWGFGFGAAVLLGLRVGALGTILRFPGPVWGELLVAALLPTLLAYVLFTRALVYVEVNPGLHHGQHRTGGVRGPGLGLPGRADGRPAVARGGGRSGRGLPGAGGGFEEITGAPGDATGWRVSALTFFPSA